MGVCFFSFFLLNSARLPLFQQPFLFCSFIHSLSSTSFPFSALSFFLTSLFFVPITGLFFSHRSCAGDQCLFKPPSWPTQLDSPFSSAFCHQFRDTPPFPSSLRQYIHSRQLLLPSCPPLQKLPLSDWRSKDPSP